MVDSQLSAPLNEPGIFPSTECVYESEGPEGWSVVLMRGTAEEEVGIRWGKIARLRRDRTYATQEYFVLPRELAASVLNRAKELEAARIADLRKSYEEQAADLDSEQEALEWSEALIGDGFESEEG